MKCRFCDSETILSSTGRIINNYELFVDPSCGSIGVLNKPRHEEIKSIYDELFETGEYKQHRIEFEQIQNGRNVYMPFRKILLRYIETLSNGRKMLEIGGGVGSFGVYAQKRGWDYLDMDVSESAINFVSKLGLSTLLVTPSNLCQMPVDKYDLVVMWEVIEHVYEVNDYMKAIHSSLKPGGFLLLSTPNYYREAYQGLTFGKLSSPPIHLNFFTKSSLGFVLKSTGFDIVRIFKRRLLKPYKWSYPEIVKSILILAGFEESPTLIGIARKSE